ncbi:MAG: CoA transferase subunit A [Chloroflexia bacterium]
MATEPEPASTFVAEPGRTSKVLDLPEAVERLVPDRSPSLWVGGMHMHNVPMALVRECIRQGKRFETLYAGPSVSLAAELLLGAGLVDRVLCSYIGFEHLGLAPVFRRIGESGAVHPEIVDVDGGSLTLALQAGAWGQPFAVLPPSLETTDLPKGSPGFYRRVTDPFGTGRYLAVEAVRPSVALVHCQQADENGNGIFKGSPFCDRLVALASSTVLMQVEGLVDNNQVLKYPKQTGIPSFEVSAVVPVNFGCHPTSSHRYYNYDDVHLRLYLKAAATEEGFADYLRDYVLGPEDQEEYMRRVQNQDWGAIGSEER